MNSGWTPPLRLQELPRNQNRIRVPENRSGLPSVRLVGGWGHDNLGDEAILAAYLSYFRSRANVEVRSPSVEITALALGNALQDGNTILRPDSSKSRPDNRVTILCGGGYLNGSWHAKFEEKLIRLISLRPYATPLIIHAVELQGLRGTTQKKLTTSAIRSKFISVRDSGSKRNLGQLGFDDVSVVPDAISLFYPTVDSCCTTIPELEDKVVVNLLDIGGRPDAKEGELDVSGWDEFVSELCAKYSGRLIGLDVGAYDAEYMRKFDIPIIKTRTVRGLISVLGSASAVLSTRMHPALLASQLGTPTVSVPYCAKVRPTLTNIGLENMLLTKLDVAATTEIFSARSSFTEEWKSAYHQSSSWLSSSMDSVL